MRVIEADSVPWTEVSGHRSGGIEFKRLFQGTTGAPDNFEFSLTRVQGDYYTPRHRHNFDQVRYAISGVMNYAPKKDLTAGMVGYFPEGTFYGPQAGGEDSVVLLAQLGGASGSGFMSYQQLNSGYEQLRTRGEFKEGSFSYRDDQGNTHRKDGYEAVWEHVNGRPVDYPKPRFEEPILMHPENFQWVTSEHRGVRLKQVGAFGERGLAVGLIAADPGASCAFGILAAHNARRLLFVIDGSLEIGNRQYGAQTSISMEPGDHEAVFEAAEKVELFYLDLPRFLSL
jgi:hypothetical protein